MYENILGSGSFWSSHLQAPIKRPNLNWVKDTMSKVLVIVKTGIREMDLPKNFLCCKCLLPLNKFSYL